MLYLFLTFEYSQWFSKAVPSSLGKLTFCNVSCTELNTFDMILATYHQVASCIFIYIITF